MAEKYKRQKAEPREGSEFLSDVVGRNVQGMRGFVGLSQLDLAARMTALGHRWYGTTVGQVEKGLRLVSVEELLCLALALSTTMYSILSPGAPIYLSSDRMTTIEGHDIDLGPSAKVDRPSVTIGVVPFNEVDRIIYPRDRSTLWTHLVVWEGNEPVRLWSPRTEDPLASIRKAMEEAGMQVEKIDEILDGLKRASEPAVAEQDRKEDE